MENKCNNGNISVKSMLFVKKSDCKTENCNLKIKRKYAKNKREIIKHEQGNFQQVKTQNKVC